MTTERTVAQAAPNVTDGIVVNTFVVAPDWINDDPTHYAEYTPEHLCGIGWQIVDGVCVLPPPPPDPDPVPSA